MPNTLKVSFKLFEGNIDEINQALFSGKIEVAFVYDLGAQERASSSFCLGTHAIRINTGYTYTGGGGGGGGDCPADHQVVNGVFGSSGRRIGNYYFSSGSGTHAMINVGEELTRMRVQKWNSARWVKVAGSTSQIQYNGTRGYHRMVLKGDVGSPYNVCFKRP